MFNSNLGWVLTTARRYDEAMAQYRKTLELDPNFVVAYSWLGGSGLGWCSVYKGDTAGAIAAFQKAKALDPQPYAESALAYAYARAGDRAKAEQMLRDWDDRAKQRYLSPGLRVILHLGLGEKDKALDWLEKCYEEQDAYCWGLKVYADLRPPAHRAALPGAAEKSGPRPMSAGTEQSHFPKGSSLGSCESGLSIGAGEMGEVFSARDTRLRRAVAVKVIPSHSRLRCASGARGAEAISCGQIRSTAMGWL